MQRKVTDSWTVKQCHNAGAALTLAVAQNTAANCSINDTSATQPVSAGIGVQPTGAQRRKIPATY